MRIAQVTATFPPYEAGTGRVCYYNAVELARLGHEVTVFTANYPPEHPPYPPEITVKRLPVWFRLGNAPLLPNLLSIRNFDIIHLHFPFIFGAELVWLDTRLRNIPYVITHHNDLVSRGSRNLLFDLYFPLTKRFAAHDAKKYVVVAMGHAQHCALTSLYEQRWEDVVEVFNGVDIDIFCPDLDGVAVRQQLNIPADASVITFVGALDRAHLFKGVETLLASFAQLARPNTWLMIVGDGNMRPKYEALAANLGIADRVIFVGKVAHDHLGPYYVASDVVVLPSTPPESFGMVLIEAGACGKPVIASDIPGVRSVVDDGQNGLLIKPRDVADLTDKLETLLDNPEMRRQMGNKGLHKVLEQYTWKQAAVKLEKVYEDVLNTVPRVS